MALSVLSNFPTSSRSRHTPLIPAPDRVCEGLAKSRRQKRGDEASLRSIHPFLPQNKRPLKFSEGE